MQKVHIAKVYGSPFHGIPRTKRLIYKRIPIESGFRASAAYHLLETFVSY
jgi:hypothetical protein